jgi:virginiamycin B lyase
MVWQRLTRRGLCQTAVGRRPVCERRTSSRWRRHRPGVECLDGRQLLAVTINEFPLPSIPPPSENLGIGPVTAGPDGNLWFPENFSHLVFNSGPLPTTVFDPGKIGRITPSGVITEFSVDTNPGTIVVGPDGNLWFPAPSISPGQSNGIDRITPSGNITEFPLPAGGGSAGALTIGPDSNLWFPEIAGGPPQVRIGRITPSGIVTEFPVPSPQFLSAGLLTSAPDGNLWFREDEGMAIGRITPSGAVTAFPFPEPIDRISTTDPLAIGPDGNLWFIDQYFLQGLSTMIDRITPSGAITEFPFPQAATASVLRSLIAGPDGNLWFLEIDPSASIDRITPSGSFTEFPLSSPSFLSFGSALTSAPDGNLWFNEGGAAVGRITPSGAVTDFTIPSGSKAGVLTVGPDGNLWFPEAGGIGEVVLDKPPAVTGVVSVAHSRKEITAIVLGFSEDLNPSSAGNAVFYSLDAGVKKRHRLQFTKHVKIGSVSYNGTTHQVTITLARPFKGKLQITARGGIEAANGLSSNGDFTAVVK